MTAHPCASEGPCMPEIAVQLIDPAHAEDEELLQALRLGDERAYVALVRRYGGLMQRVALSYVRTPAVAEEVVQETWCAVLTGLERFEGRAALKTWLFRILTNRAKTRGQREARTVPVLLAGRRRRGRGPVGRSRALPACRPPALARPLGGGPGAVERRPGRAAARARGPLADPPRHRRAARASTGGHLHARRRGLAARGGLRGARPQRGQPAGPAAPRALPCARRARALLRRRGGAA